MTDLLEHYISKHRNNGILVDTNLLLLFLLGQVNPRRIPDFDRTSSYQRKDFDLLVRLIGEFAKLLVTPHILAEAVNLLRLTGEELAASRELIRDLANRPSEFVESYLPASELTRMEEFARLGLTDAAISAACQGGCLVVTADGALHGWLLSVGCDSIRFQDLIKASAFA